MRPFAGGGGGVSRVSHGHEVSEPINSTRRQSFQDELLIRLDAVDGPTTQRSLANELGIALGLTNLLVRVLVKRGLVRVVKLQANQVKYLLTPAGLAMRAKVSQRRFKEAVRFYSDARDRVRLRLRELANEISASDEKRIVFFGGNQVAEIAWVCLQETDFHLVGVVDDDPQSHLRMAPVYPTRSLAAGPRVGDEAFDRLIVMSFHDPSAVRRQLRSIGFPAERTFWL